MDKIKRFATKNRICSAIIYVLFLGYSRLFSLLMFAMRIFPVEDGKKHLFSNSARPLKILCTNMKGKRFGDNPMYLCKEMLLRWSRNAPATPVHIVWLIKEDSMNQAKKDLEELLLSCPDYDTQASTSNHISISLVPYTTLQLAYQLSTAGLWIDSNTKPYGTLKRKCQLYIQTWHGSYGLKKMYGDIPEKITAFDKAFVQYNSRIEDLVLSNATFASDIFRRAFWYQGEILECGSPRNDIFFQSEDTLGAIKTKVSGSFGTGTQKLALYAPTYRSNLKTDALSLDFRCLKTTLEKRFGGEWAILVRLHPQNMIDAQSYISYDDSILSATEYGVMQELLVACDVLISDYSSCVLDFVTTPKPCFLFATDLSSYKEEHDLYFEIDKLPFPKGESNEELMNAILSFDEKKYADELQLLHKNVGLCDKGTACRDTIDWITRKVFKI